jgi:hypothetical protein
MLQMPSDTGHLNINRSPATCDAVSAVVIALSDDFLFCFFLAIMPPFVAHQEDVLLCRMKKQLAAPASTPSSSSSSSTVGRPKVKDAIDMELEALRRKVRE